MVGRIIDNLKAEFPEVRFTEIDISQHPEIAVKYRIMATPAIAINGKLEFLGAPKESELRGRLLSRR